MKGHIEKRVGKKGTTWTVVIDLPRDPLTGKRRQKRLSAPTKKELEALQAKTLHELQRGTYIESTTTTVTGYLSTWLEAIEPTVRPATYLRYRGCINLQIAPALGSIPLAKLSPIHIQDFYAGRLVAGLSPTTVRLYHGVLHRALDQAVKWRMIAYNACDAVDVPRAARSEMKTWTAQQARAFLDGTVDHPLAALWRLAVVTGMRRGELLALRWQDVDLERKAVAIRRTLTRGKDGLGFNEPKSAAGKRSVALPASCVAALRQHRIRQNERRLQWGEAWQDTGLVFDRGDGAYVPLANLDRHFKQLTAVLGLPRIRFHDLRHTAATLMLEQGVHAKIVQERLGHSDISMTLNRYSHVSMGMQQEAADRLDAALGG